MKTNEPTIKINFSIETSDSIDKNDPKLNLIVRLREELESTIKKFGKENLTEYSDYFIESIILSAVHSNFITIVKYICPEDTINKIKFYNEMKKKTIEVFDYILTEKI